MSKTQILLELETSFLSKLRYYKSFTDKLIDKMLEMSKEANKNK